ncbi:MAG: ATP-binding protein [Deltaproteobacteria bacterium]|jgi:hypothetical protein|nr:ATP-binding protein [Deltaproteobacteria bacterium]
MSETAKRALPAVKSKVQPAAATAIPKKINMLRMRHSFSICLVGDSGVGKTRMAFGTTPPGSRTLGLVTENGLMSVVDDVLARPEDFDMRLVKTSAEFRGIVNWLYQNPDRFNIVVLDSATALMNILYTECVNKGMSGFGLYGKISEDLRKLMVAFCELPIITVTTVLEDNHLADDGSRKIEPRLRGRDARGEFFAWFDEVFHMNKILDEGETSFTYSLYTAKNGFLPGKDRSGKLEICEPEFNLAALLEKMVGKLPERPPLA